MPESRTISSIAGDISSRVAVYPDPSVNGLRKLRRQLSRELRQDRSRARRTRHGKAMSWALRELAKRDPGSVETYLTKYSAKLAPRVLREVRNKLSTGLKNPKGLLQRIDRHPYVQPG